VNDTLNSIFLSDTDYPRLLSLAKSIPLVDRQQLQIFQSVRGGESLVSRQLRKMRPLIPHATFTDRYAHYVPIATDKPAFFGDILVLLDSTVPEGILHVHLGNLGHDNHIWYADEATIRETTDPITSIKQRPLIALQQEPSPTATTVGWSIRVNGVEVPMPYVFLRNQATFKRLAAGIGAIMAGFVL
jgi:hypothetical protein